MSGIVLVVEDEPFIRMDVSLHLEDCGFQVLQAANATEAMTIISLHPNIDLLFTDVRMPGEMDGLELARWVMAHHLDMAVMIASGELGRETAMRELCGARAFTKPYKLDVVTEAMLEMLAQRKSSSKGA